MLGNTFPFCAVGTLRRVFWVAMFGSGQALEVVQEPSLEDATLYQDPLDAHAAVIPQFELNAYDALNALTMECDAFVEGDLLVTFPQCKEAEGCRILI